ncbi:MULTISPECIES: alpha/beta fold hydrolase [Micromonospora]|uniref:Alpha/beta hydrolase n=1 Tax=Micromonospora solifontis TaxID=2487138 RepID=A0ABX9WCK8_9ACTN|nr:MULTISPECIES: alpha/beta hydrolase [Micromonospora]NES12966.1 alpha/beta hydrolase [Micromonospora sp. PPF5-17B]NES38546.1 alpha/beta hydrolase [Micromonospora solifontis]NES54891.1 alpha/beta hydrolase [Micromonospora sp. PPF5-6]RNL95002.1 alpha/beta hydrolase [Micromonospora solifontis]
MSSTSTASATTGSLAVPDGRLHYEVRGQGPLVALVAAPMDADAFAPLADLLAADRTVLTTDPRGIRRSVLHDPHQDSTPELRADDLSRLLAHLDAGPAAVLGSSGGAVTVLALAQAHPEQVHTVVAHEPPLLGLLDDRTELLAREDDMIATYLAGDRLGAGRKFLANANIHLPEELVLAMFGGQPEPQAAADEHFQYVHMIRGTTRFRPDVAALRDGPTRVVVGLGETSTGQVCDRTSRALAAALGAAPALFPGGHIGFVEDPAAFATRLHAVLAEG